MRAHPLLPLDPYESARIVGLRYVRHEGPGILRRRSGRGFVYVDPYGKIVRQAEELGRIRSLVIPPAWTDVWISPFANGHLQAVGRDARGRKQYRYHSLYRQVRELTKFERMVPFANLLPAIQKRLRKDLNLPGCPKEKVIAAIVRLLETSCIRVGNDDYARENDSFGLTTLQRKHVRVQGNKIRFHFKGKSGQIHDIEVQDPKVANIVRKCQRISRRQLFQYIADDGHACRITSEDVNEYLRSTTRGDFTAKDFRTWVGTREAARLLNQLGPPANQTQAKRDYAEAVKQVAKKLGNRPATTRKSYLHPAIYDSYLDGSLFDVMQNGLEGNSARASRAEQLCIVALILTHQELGKAPLQAA